MSFLDMRTVMFMMLAIDCTCTLLLIPLWLQNRRRYTGTHLWVLSLAANSTGILLIALRGIVPDWISIVAGNSLSVAGAVAMVAGLNRFMGRRAWQHWNGMLLAAFVGIQIYFTYVQPHVPSRVVNYAAALFIVSMQGVWLLFHHSDGALRPAARGAAIACGGYCLISIARIVRVALSPYLGEDFLHSGTFESMFMASYAILTILLTYSLSLMLNSRLLEGIRTEEEKFSKVFHSSSQATCLIRLSDGMIIEVNAGYLKLSGYSREELIGQTSIGMNIWFNEAERNAYVEDLSKSGSIRERELRFRKKNGEMMDALVSSDILTIHGEPATLSSMVDITERKRHLLEREELISKLQKALSEVRTLSGLLPICSSCKKIRDDQGYWGAIENYISQHSEATFSHGICPECAERLYPGFGLYGGKVTDSAASPPPPLPSR